MPRTSRKQSESGIFHVMMRGIDRQVIFHDDEDCEKYLQYLWECQKDAFYTLKTRGRFETTEKVSVLRMN